jgi:twinkle protein|tara:strand:- start:53 stop:1738 length:1686 start_codon:yes stop_codon:yes gene_type:complete
MAFVKIHQPCTECSSSDGAGINEDGSAFCFSCHTHIKNYTGGKEETIIEETEFEIHKRNKKMEGSDSFSSQSSLIFTELTDRKLSLATAKKYGVKATLVNGVVASHHYPYFNGHELAATKIRKKDKAFIWSGTPKEVGLFGENLFKGGGKFITLTEGECDAMAAYELMGSKWPAVSVKSGAGGGVGDVKANLEYLESFENVVINFDNDKPGKEAAIEVAKLLTPGKAKIMSLPVDFKDANDMLRQGRHSAYVSSFWDAKIYTPSGVLNLSDQFLAYQELRNNKVEAIPYPWFGLNTKLEGMRAGELVTLTGGTGLGKSSVTREIEHWLIDQTDDNVGVIALEENWSRTAEGIMAVEANAKLHLDSVKANYTDEEMDNYFKKVFMGDNEGRVWIHAHHGVNNVDDIFSKLRYMIIGLDCKWIVVDHLHMLVLSTLESDERKAIDGIMHRLRTLVEETGCGMILVSHLRRVDGNRGHENGIETGLNHLRGSQSIAQLSDCVIALERNQQADDDIEASTTKVRVLKSRYTGDVGIATHLLYDQETGRLRETHLPDGDEFTGDEL